MIDLNKIYTIKSNATRDIRRAVERGECKPSEYEARPVAGGFQIVNLNAPAPTIASPVPKADNIPDVQMAVLNALLSAKALADRSVEERAEVWVPFAAVHDSDNPNNLPKPSMAGIAGGLVKRGLIRTEGSKDDKGRRVAMVQITCAGLEALKA